MARKRSVPKSGAGTGKAESVAGVSTEAAPQEVDEIAGLSPEVVAALMAKLDEKPKKPGLLVQWAPVIVAGLLLWFGYAFILNGDKPTPDRPDSKDALVKLARDAFASTEDAQQFASACRIMGAIIVEDGKGKENPTLSRRSQISESLIQEFARATLLSDISADPKGLAELILAAFDEDSEFPEKEAVLSDDDRDKARAAFERLAKAAEEV